MSKKKYSVNITRRNLFKEFIKNHPEYAKLTYNEFSEIYSQILSGYKNEIAVNPHGVRLSFYMGDLAQKYIPTKGLNRNLGLIKHNEVDAEHLNFGSNGKQGKLVWSVEHARKFNKYLRYMGFTGSTNFKNQVADAFDKTPEIFKTNIASKSNRSKIRKRYEAIKQNPPNDQ